MNLETIFNDISGAIIIWTVLFLVSVDVVLGILNSLKQHHFKSSINRSGIINKSGIVIAVLFFYVLDIIMGLDKLGFSELMGSTLCLSELVSILYNLKSLNVPFPKNVIDFIDRFTAEKKE